MITETQKLELKCKYSLSRSRITEVRDTLLASLDRVLQKHPGIMDFFMENEDLCKVQNLYDLQDGP